VTRLKAALSSIPPMSTAAPPRRRTPFLRGLRTAILLDFEAELLLCERYAVLAAAGFRKGEITQMLAASPAAIKSAEQRVKNASSRLEAGDD
jgi:hypothetical protein